jgi:serine/threonine-protein kinase
MSSLSRWPHADELLDRALALPAGARPGFVREAAGSDAELAEALQSILAEATAEDGFLAPGGPLSGRLGEELARVLHESEPTRSLVSVGTRIAHYEVLEAIGHGGMGEVFRARDLLLGRDVAIKVLPQHFAHDRERRLRFQREAQVLASLSHPGIAAIYGIAPTEEFDALVLEFVTGSTLSHRLRSGAFPIDEALAAARLLAEALEAAHRRGIVHRDFKPGNIKIAPDGATKILDFGLAKAIGGSGADPDDLDLTGDTGRILGTPAYMSPEQARGRAVDLRTDIWAFGCVLFEMLTGTRAFQGDSRSDVIARVIERDPPFELLPAGTPAPVRRLLRRCLEKDQKRRLGYIGDAVLDLDDAVRDPADAGRPHAFTGTPTRRRWMTLGITMAAGAAGLAAGMGLTRWQKTPPRALTRLAVAVPEGDALAPAFQPLVAISPDERTIVYRARRGGVAQLFRRSLDDLEPRAIEGTENATGPFFSPDGRWLGFDSDGVLKRLPLAGGPAVTIAAAPGGATASWGPGDIIVFATNTGRVLQRVSASGGAVTTLSQLDKGRGDTLHLLPQVLPDGTTVIFTVISGTGRLVSSLSLTTGETRVLTQGTHGRYIETGHLVFARDGSLWVAPFDARRVGLTGEPTALAEKVEATDQSVWHFAVGPAGTMVYMPPATTVGQRRLAWIDRKGRETPFNIEPGPYERLSLSPKDHRVALALRSADNTDIWVGDERGALSRLTLDPTIETMPVWSPDGRRVAFRSEQKGPGIFTRVADGSGEAERLTETSGPIHSPYSWTPDGRALLFAVFRSFRSQAIASVTTDNRQVRVLLDGEFAQLDPQVSPDGRWLAYQSDETGRFEVYVRPFPEVDRQRWPVSTAGGMSPRWSGDGGELFYFDGAALNAVSVSGAPGFRAGAATRLFEIKPFFGRLGPDYEVSRDTQRFLFMFDVPAVSPQARLILVQHWVDSAVTR